MNQVLICIAAGAVAFLLCAVLLLTGVAFLQRLLMGFLWSQRVVWIHQTGSTNNSGSC